MRSARLRLPLHIRRPTSRVTFRLLYLGSGNTTRCGTVPRRGIRSILPFSYRPHTRPNNLDARQREGYRSYAPAPHSSGAYPNVRRAPDLALVRSDPRLCQAEGSPWTGGNPTTPGTRDALP